MIKSGSPERCKRKKKKTHPHSQNGKWEGAFFVLVEKGESLAAASFDFDEKITMMTSLIFSH